MAFVSDLVSVVIPTYNAAPWIGAAVAAAFAQDHAPTEVIVADNGSTDDTIEVAKASGAVRVVNAERRGPSAARNAGLDAARGEFVQFLDADDLLAPGKVSRQLAALRAGTADVAWGTFTRFRDGADPDPFGAMLCAPRIDSDPAADLIGADGFLHLGAALFRSASIGGVRFDENVRVVEDVRFLLALALRGARFAHVPGPPGYAMREHDSATRASLIVRESEFWLSAASNAEFVRAGWLREGEPLTPSRREALAAVWMRAAERLAVLRDPRLDEVLGWLGDLDPHFVRRLRQPHRLVAPLFGYGATFALAERVKSVLAPLRRGRSAGMGS
ncbi:MAG TPA: glycosyltransferase family 2 protein [Gemmatimonadaceae bacterium]|nr:glycosyltransferase family 2 protein [Gemmatimonadaceae bacterium]